MRSLGDQLPIEIHYTELPKSGDAVVVDCRTCEEFELAHIDGAINVPLQHLSICTDDFPCEKEDAIYVYCRTGNRSSTFATYLRSIGFINCQSIAGGFESWGESNQC